MSLRPAWSMKRVQDGQASVMQKDCLKNKNQKQTNKSKCPSGMCVCGQSCLNTFSPTLPTSNLSIIYLARLVEMSQPAAGDQP